MIILTEDVYKSSLGTVKWHYVKNDREEYMSENDRRWMLYDRWVSIDELRAKVKFKGDGKKVLKSFLSYLPADIGVLANPVSLDNDVSFIKLRDWYLAQGFKKIDPSGTTLMTNT